MPQIANLMPQRISVWVGVPSGTRKANKALHQSALHSILGFYYGTSGSLATSYSPPMLDIQRIVRDTIGDTLTEIHNLLTWDAGWNSYDACAPGYDAVMYADSWIVQMFLAVTASNRNWFKPNVTASEEGEVVFEWWYGARKLTIYVGNQSAEYMKVWGTDTNSEMSDGDASLISTCRSLWEWLTD